MQNDFWNEEIENVTHALSKFKDTNNERDFLLFSVRMCHVLVVSKTQRNIQKTNINDKQNTNNIFTPIQ